MPARHLRTGRRGIVARRSDAVRMGGACLRSRALAILLAALVLLPAAAAADAGSSYTMTAWTAQTGLPPGDVLAIAQDLEGALWLGTSTGLVRFDGVAFTQWANGREPRLQRNAVPAVIGTRDGSLWIGFGGAGGVSRLKNGALVDYTQADGVRPGAVASLIEDSRGTIWAGGARGVATFREGAWTTVPFDDGDVDIEVFSLFEDREGRVWAGTSQGVYALTGQAFERRHPKLVNVQGFAEDNTGALWSSDIHDIVRRLDDGEHVPPVRMPAVRIPQSGWRLSRDRRGQIWVAALGGGLLRLTHESGAPPVIDRVSYEEALAGSPRVVFNDRDDQVWVGMRGGGLLRLTDRVMTADVALDGLTNDGVRGMVSSADGSVWIATYHNLHRFSGSTREVYSVTQTRALFIDPANRMWVSTTHGLGRVEDGRFVPVPLPSDIRWDRVYSAAADASGTLWLCSLDQGIMVFAEDGAESPIAVPDASKPCSYVFTDAANRVWVGLQSGRVLMHDTGGFHSYGSSEGLPSGPVMAITQSRDGSLWVANRDGLSRYQNGRFTAIGRQNGPFEAIVSSLAEDADGYIWVGVSGGAALVRIDPGEFDKVTVNPAHNVEYRLLDESDGLRGALRWQSRPSAVTASDGRIWTATGLGVVIVSPAATMPGRRPVRPSIESIAIGDEIVTPVENTTFAANTTPLAIAYAAVSLHEASKVQFRYRLEGRDDDWVLAGAARRATYSNLAPGQYRFQVTATTDGLWTDAAAWAFTIAPPIYQQAWFIALCVAAALGMIPALWWVRVTTLRRQYALVFEARAHVSREIHDTLLQSLAAIGMELDAIDARLDRSGGDLDRSSIQRLRRQVGHSLREARDSVWNLRGAPMETRPLPEALRELAERTTTTRHVKTEFSVTGRVRPCSHDVDLQLLRICQEAVANAVRHARASRIQVTLEFRPDSVVLRVADDGCGFTRTDAEAALSEGQHLGLLGMTERAIRVGGEVTITSSPGNGAVIEATVPLQRGED